MAVRIRLSRGGSKKRPFYKIVVADQRAPRDGRFIERLGSYNPLLPKDHADRLVLNQDKVKEWLGTADRKTAETVCQSRSLRCSGNSRTAEKICSESQGSGTYERERRKSQSRCRSCRC